VPSRGRGILADVNVWLATVVEQHPHHRFAVDWWRERIMPAERTVCFCRVTQLGVLRLLTNEVVMGSARRTAEQAWRDYDRLLDQKPVAYLAEPGGLTECLRRYSSGPAPSVSRWTDAYLAGFARAGDLEMATLDRGFKRFADLRLSIIG